MDIGFVAEAFRPSNGVDRVVFELASRMRDRHDVKIFTYLGHVDEEFAEESGCEIVKIPRKNMGPATRYNGMIEGLKVLKKHGLDIINSHAHTLLISSILSGHQTVATFHSFPPWNYIEPSQRLKYSAVFLENFIGLRRATQTVAISNSVARQLERYYRVSSRVIYDGVDTTTFNPRIEPKDLGGNSILYVGRLSKYKGIHILIEAFKKVLAYVPDAKLYLIGKSMGERYHKSIRSLARNLPVHFLGEVPESELPSYYTGCSVFASATLWEGFGLPFAEAMACGKPCVGFENYSTAELIKKGESGFLSKPGDVDQFAKNIVKLLKNDKLMEQMGEVGRSTVIKRFSWDNVVLEYLKTFNEILDHDE